MKEEAENREIFPTIDDPTDLRALEISELRQVCDEIREYLIDTISRTGGHLGAGLGTVELSVALHYAFNTPDDKIIWDVGHQAYPHKLLTGRRDRFPTIRQYKGISGFLKRDESIYDVFGAGHASTAISAGLGIATARDFSGEDFKVVSVIGDGAMTGGMVYEAMNNCGLLKKDMIVVLNDNNMSIAENKWAISNYFTEMIASPTYNRFRTNIWELAGRFDELGDRFRKIASKVEGGLKAIVTPGMLFEALGFRYFGPIYGHNVVTLVKMFREVQDWSGPVLVHVVTKKGQGYAPAEKDQMRLHGVTPFDKETGKSPKKSDTAPSYTEIFGTSLIELAKKNDKIVAITAAMPSGTGLDIFTKAIPDRCFDVGIAEQHAITFAAGMATEGYIPVAAIYSTFLQRAYDQIIHDVALQKLHVVFAIDRGGLVGADGPTHHGVMDLSYLRSIPNMVVMAPSDRQEMRDMLYTAVEHNTGPVSLRYPRGIATGKELRRKFTRIETGKGLVLREGKDVAILAVGTMVQNAMAAAEILFKQDIDVSVVNMRFIKPLDTGLLDDFFAKHNRILTVEDNSVLGGFGSAVAEYLADNDRDNIILRLHGIPDTFIEQGTQEQLYKQLDLDAQGISRIVEELVGSPTRQASVKTV